MSGAGLIAKTTSPAASKLSVARAQGDHPMLLELGAATVKEALEVARTIERLNAGCASFRVFDGDALVYDGKR